MYSRTITFPSKSYDQGESGTGMGATTPQVNSFFPHAYKVPSSAVTYTLGSVATADPMGCNVTWSGADKDLPPVGAGFGLYLEEGLGSGPYQLLGTVTSVTSGASGAFTVPLDNSGGTYVAGSSAVSGDLVYLGGGRIETITVYVDNKAASPIASDLWLEVHDAVRADGKPFYGIRTTDATALLGSPANYEVHSTGPFGIADDYLSGGDPIGNATRRWRSSPTRVDYGATGTLTGTGARSFTYDVGADCHAGMIVRVQVGDIVIPSDNWWVSVEYVPFVSGASRYGVINDWTGANKAQTVPNLN